MAVQEPNLPPEKLIGYQEIRLHMIFDIKLGKNFQCKARMVTGGHTTKTPSPVTYISMVSRDSVILMIMVAVLNDLDLQAVDIKNSYINASCRENIWTRAVMELRIYEGKIFIVFRVLYSLKVSGAAFTS